MVSAESVQPTRPAIRYFGGKWRLAPWIIEQFPPHEVYVEPFGGGANVLLRKPRSKVEIYNDLDEDLVNLFRVLRDPASAAALIQMLELTPFARGEWEAAYERAPDPVEAARRLIVRSFMGHSSNGVRTDRTTGFRACNLNANAAPARSWSTYPEALRLVAERVRGVAIEREPAVAMISRRDRADVLFYVDPPYVPATRCQKRTRGELSHGYRHDMDDGDHVELLETLNGVDGMVVLSGYPSDLYDRMLTGWTVLHCEAMADGAIPRTECLWLNPAAVAARTPGAADEPWDLFGGTQ